jgi:NAD(P)-dependent dehydrogenase (short-subunit alcohol dehydrogenase family)
MRRVVITGVARGIGRVCAEQFRDGGWHVIGVDIDPFNLPGTESHVCDLSDKAAIEALCKAIDPPDALINNAAIMTEGDPRTLDAALWEKTLAINLTAPFLLSRTLAGSLKSIVNIASTRAMMSEPFTESYSASKGGLVALTHALAMSLAPVRVNAISPGWIEHARPEALREVDHHFHPVGRVGRAADVAQMALYLCSEAAGFITAQNFTVDGGVTKKMIYPE